MIPSFPTYFRICMGAPRLLQERFAMVLKKEEARLEEEWPGKMLTIQDALRIWEEVLREHDTH